MWRSFLSRLRPQSNREQQQAVHLVEQLDEVSRQLIIREEELFSQAAPSEEDEDQLQRDLEDLKLQIWAAVHNSFTMSSSSSAAGQFKVLRSAVDAILQQEAQDRRWTDSPQDQVPVWRPQKCLSTHNSLLQNMVESRLTAAVATDDNMAGTDKLSSNVKKQVCRLGRCVKDDLLAVMRTVKNCYPPHMDILNVYARLYHQSFSTQLTELAASRLEVDDCSYLLFWVNQYYPQDLLKHEELDGHIKMDGLGSLLLQDDLNQLEEQFLAHKEDKVKLWLHTALQKEEESWLSGRTPELIDSYCFSPLAVDVIQVMESSLAEFRCAIKDQGKAQRLTCLLETFLCSYERSMTAFLKGSHGNARSVIKAQLVCEQQLRDYITAQTESLSEQQRHHCLHTLSALRDCGYQCLIGPLHAHVKTGLSLLGTEGWVDGSFPVVDSLLDSLNQQLSDLVDLKPACRQSLLSYLHQDVVLQYVKRIMKTRIRSREQQVEGAQQITKDTQKIDSFFTEELLCQ
ncbi:tumor necrosis factor alpha-induced protein 2a isoform X2 [Parambassis ranga]|uniref:Tumor necrosis factor alpha-induced protein 2a isoform X2 n=1 Tax=Parambassis ranga TaxID=210632 RepID=A0A6P7HB46_9TELE|nr:tumor necrosis factor alpha-induced protein 2-like isoform X2 [Parambassis ranga]